MRLILREISAFEVINLSRNYGALVTLVVFHCPEDIYFQRNRERRHSIPEDLLVRQIEQMEFPELDEGDRTLVIYENGNTLRTIKRARNPQATSLTTYGSV